MTTQAQRLDTLTQALAELHATVQALVQAQAPAPTAKPSGKPQKRGKARTQTAKPSGGETTIGCQHAGGHAPSGALTHGNYVATLAAARAAGHPWADGSMKPVKHILHAAGIARTRENLAKHASIRVGGK